MPHRSVRWHRLLCRVAALRPDAAGGLLACLHVDLVARNGWSMMLKLGFQPTTEGPVRIGNSIEAYALGGSACSQVDIVRMFGLHIELEVWR